MVARLILLFHVLAIWALTACTTPPPPPGEHDVLQLAATIRNLGPDVDPAEANRAARIAYAYSAQLKQEYGVTDPPLVHNAKVNRGVRPRGLCWHWADDLEARLKQEQFQTLTLHRAIANSDNPILIDHSTAIIARKGDPQSRGIVLDPWRYGGILFWAPVRADTRYTWVPREEVFAKKRARAAERETQPAN